MGEAHACVAHDSHGPNIKVFLRLRPHLIHFDVTLKDKAISVLIFKHISLESNH